MSLSDRINQRNRTPTCTLRLDGRRVPGVLLISHQQDYGQGVSGATVVLRDPPVTPVSDMPIRWTWGYNGDEIPGLTGYVITPTRVSYPRIWSLSVQDELFRARREQRPIVTSPLNNISAQDAIEYILSTYAGITRMNIPDIQAPGGGGSWMLGTLTPVSWSKTTALAAAQEIAQTAGYWLYCDAGGTVRARQMERRPSDSPFRTLRGGDAAGATLLVEGAPLRRQDGEQVRNRITVRGANTGVEGAQLFDIFLATHALYPGVVADLDYSSFLLEEIGDVTAVAERLAALYNRKPNNVTARIKADPRLAVGTTVAIEDSGIGYSSPQNFFIYSIRSTFDARSGNFSQDLTLDGGTGDGGYSLNPPPVAVLQATIELETLNGVDSALVILDGSGSYSQSGGEIVSWEFTTPSTVTAGTPTGSTAPHARDKFTLVFPASSSPVSITLEVTDTNSKVDEVTLELDLAGDGITLPEREAIAIAGGAAWLISPDGGATWNDESVTSTLVPQIDSGVWPASPVGDLGTYGQISSGSTALRQTLDALATAPTTLNTAASTITALYRNPRNAARVWRSRGALVERSTDGGTTWAAWGTPSPGDDVLCIIEDPALDNSVFCLAGSDMFQSIGPAPSWAVFYGGPSGAVARWMVRSEDGTITWIAYTGTFSDSPLHRVEGPLSVTFPVLSPTVDEIRALALNDMIEPGSPTLIAIDQENRLFTMDGLTGLSVEQSAETYPAGATVQHMVHSRVAPLVYIADFDSVAAGTGAVQKYVYQGDSLLGFKDLDTGQQAHMVGIAGESRISAFGVYMGISDILDTSQNGIYKYSGGAWARCSSGLPVERHVVVDIQANPANPLQIVATIHSNVNWQVENSGGKIVSVAAWGLSGAQFSPWWYSGDGGASWQEIEVNETLPAAVCCAFVTVWTSNGQWCLSWHNPAPGYHNVAVRGSGTTPGSPVTDTGWAARWFTAGQSGDVVFLQRWPGGALNLYTLTPGGSYVTSPGSALPYTLDGMIEREPAGRAIAMGPDALGSGGSGAISATADYRAATVADHVGSLTNIKTLSWSIYGLHPAEFGGSVNEFSKIVDPLGTPSLELIAPGLFGGAPVQGIRADRQTRAIVGFRTDGERFFIYDGVTATNIGYPIASPSVFSFEVTA